MIRKKIIAFSSLLAAAILMPIQSAQALTVNELRSRLDNQQTLTIIDIRLPVSFSQAHIPGAINMPYSSIARKKLPPLGMVVVYGDGIDMTVTRNAVAELNRKPGINAEMLQGGFPAWSAVQQSNYTNTGMQAMQVPEIGYKKLKQLITENNDITLVDLREEDGVSLRTEFPQVESINAKQQDIKIKVNAVLTHHGKNNHRLLVLIDGGDGVVAEAVAIRLHAAGIKRLAILTGGEDALQTKGETKEQTRIDGVNQ